jgi:hypothetical protein
LDNSPIYFFVCEFKADIRVEYPFALRARPSAGSWLLSYSYKYLAGRALVLKLALAGRPEETEPQRPGPCMLQCTTAAAQAQLNWTWTGRTICQATVTYDIQRVVLHRRLLFNGSWHASLAEIQRGRPQTHIH